jgi:hypothetical protein
MRKAGIALIIVGATLSVPIPFAIGLLRHNRLENLPNPTPEDVSAGVRSSFLVAVAGFVLIGLGVLLTILSNKTPPGPRGS